MASLEARVEVLEEMLLNQKARVFFIDTDNTPDVEAEQKRLLEENRGKNYKFKFLILMHEDDREQAEKK
jgi:hypothetical protein